MAYDLALSLKLHAPKFSRAIVTDVPEPRLAEVFDSVIPIQSERGDGYRQKLSIDQYSPYERTIFIDADCLVMQDLWGLFVQCSTTPFGYAGELRGEGTWYEVDLGSLCQQRGYLGGVVTLNTGFFQFGSGAESQAIFARARELHDTEVDSLGFCSFRGTRSDEPALALALTEAGCAPLDDNGCSMRTPIGIVGPMRIDVLKGVCEFTKYDRPVTPSIVHFATWQYNPIYYRERAKLRAYFKSAVTRPFSRLAGNMVYIRESLQQLFTR